VVPHAGLRQSGKGSPIPRASASRTVSFCQHIFYPNRSGGLLGFAEIGRFQTPLFRSILIVFSSVKVEESLNRDLRGDESAAAHAVAWLGSLLTNKRENEDCPS
jgi:hypothetical protein